MDSTRFDINLLVTLEALLAEHNVTRAAKRLNLSQPAVSAQLNRLRDLFDDQLFIPARRGLVPTPRADELREPLRQALEMARATVTSHRAFKPSSAKLTVVLACTDYLQVTLAAPFIAYLRKEAPDIRVALRNLDIGALHEQLADGVIDLALMTPSHAPSNLRSKHLYDERYVLIARRGHPQLGRQLDVAEYSELEHVIVSLRGSDFSTSVDAALNTLGYRRKVVVSANSFLSVVDLVATTDLVALIPERLARCREVSITVIDLLFPVEGFDVGMVWHERTQDHSGHRWIREMIARAGEAILR